MQLLCLVPETRQSILNSPGVGGGQRVALPSLAPFRLSPWSGISPLLII